MFSQDAFNKIIDLPYETGAGSIIECSDGYLCFSSVPIDGTNDWDIAITKLSSTGDSLWVKYKGKKDTLESIDYALSDGQQVYAIGYERFDKSILYGIDISGELNWKLTIDDGSYIGSKRSLEATPESNLFAS